MCSGHCSPRATTGELTISNLINVFVQQLEVITDVLGFV